MNEKKTKIPKRRLKEFKNAEAWEQRKLIDNAEKVLDYRGKSPIKFGMEWGNEGYLVLSALNVKNGYIDKSVEAKYGSLELFERWMGDNRLVKGDVLFTTEAPLGNVAQVPDNNGYILNQRAVAFKASKETDNNFFAQLLGSPIVQNILNSNSTGGTAKGIGMKEFAKINAFVPKLEEQQKIGFFFKQLDNTITLQERKIEKLKQLKSAYLTEMFPAGNYRKPYKRFENFGEAWEQRKLGDIVEFFSGLTYSPSNIVAEGTFVLRSSNVKGGELVNADNVYVDSSVVNSSNVQKGDIIVVVRNGSRDLIGKHAQVKNVMENTVIGAFMTGIRSAESNFINAILDTHQFKIEINKNLGATINQITTGAFKKMLFSVTSNIEEQQEIGSFFKQLDDTITLQEEKLKKLHDLKSAYLTEMFV